MSRRYPDLERGLGLTTPLLLFAVSGTGAACSTRSDVDQVPIGTAVEVTRQDGGVDPGTLTARDDRTVRVTAGPTARSIFRDEIASIALADGATAPPLPAVARFREYTLPEGAVLAVRLGSAVGSDTSQVEDPVEATLTRSVLVDGVEVLPVGSVVTGFVTGATPSGKVKGRASLAVRFQSLMVPGRAEKYTLSALVHHTAPSTATTDAKKIGIPAAGGAIVGAIIGGKKGAGIGATVGGGAGTAVVLTTAGPEIRLPVGTVLSIALDEALNVRVPIEDTSRR